jgi:hypothetical protein
MALWAELLGHPAKILYDPWTNFAGSAGITSAAGIWFDLDEML